ncbi:tyrosine-type recombinase/integrase [Streptomyces sp. 35G-GA-8]|uniref:tyrosine-type recombinase/integrase n=1 Tax=Streptomyces sp. 35G-GA-8 TaxID=2939434 RepID=UPI0035B34D8C
MPGGVLHRPQDPGGDRGGGAPPAVTGCSRCSHSLCIQGSARANPSACARKTSTWPAEPPASNAPTPAALPPSRPRGKSSERPIALPTPRLYFLEQHRSRQLQEGEAAGTGWQESGYVFTRPDGAPIAGSTLTWHVNTPLGLARLRHIRFHDLRHATATLLLEQGVELVVIKELLGHARIGVTATVYTHVRLRLQRDAINPLGHTFRNPAEITGKARRRRRRTSTLRGPRPLTLPSTTAVRPRWGPAKRCLAGPMLANAHFSANPQWSWRTQSRAAARQDSRSSGDARQPLRVRTWPVSAFARSSSNSPVSHSTTWAMKLPPSRIQLTDVNPSSLGDLSISEISRRASVWWISCRIHS